MKIKDIRFYRKFFSPYYLLIQILLIAFLCSCASVKKTNPGIHSDRDAVYMETRQFIIDLDGFDPGLREKAAIALGDMDHIKDKHISSTVQLLNTADYSNISMSIAAINECAESMEDSIVLLCHVLKDIDPNVRIAAAKSLGLINRELISSLEPLISVNKKFSKGKNNEMQNIVLESKRTYERVSPLTMEIETSLIKSLDDIDPKVKKVSLKSIAGIDIHEIVQLEDAVFIADSQNESLDAEEEPYAENVFQNSDLTSGSEECIDSFTSELEWVLGGLDSFVDSDRRFSAAAIESICYVRIEKLSEQINFLKFGDVSSKTDAADAIASIATDMDKAVTALCHAMEDVDDQVRAASANSLGQIVGPLALTVSPLELAPRDLEILVSNDEKNQDGIMKLYLDNLKLSTQKAVLIINSIIDKTLPALVANIEDENYIVRNSVADSLREISPELVATTKNAKGDNKEVFTASTVDEKDLPLLIMINDLGNMSTTVARKAANDLGALGPDAKGAVPALIKAINNKSNYHAHYKYVRRDSIIAIGKIGPPAYEAVPVLISLQNDLNYEVRTEAVKALGLIGAGEAVPHLVKVLGKDSSPTVREAAATALENCDPIPYLDICYRVLFKALKDPDGKVSLNAFKTLAKYETKNKGRGIIHWKPMKNNFQTYRVCIKENEGIEKNCMDTGLITACSLGYFPAYNKEDYSIEVEAYNGSKSYKVKWTHINITRVLKKAAGLELDPNIKKGKEEALAILIKTLKPEGDLNAGLAHIEN